MDDRQKLGLFLKKIRVERQMTQSSFAVLLGVSQATISKFEQGQLAVDFLEMRRIAMLIGIPLEILARQFDAFVMESTHESK